MADIIRYRKKIITQNLKNSFPEKDEKEIKRITKKYYRHLCDITLESIKGYTLSKKKLLKKCKVINPEIGDKFFEQGKNIIYAGGHYGNWEWGTRVAPLTFKHKIKIMYKPIRNKYIDRYINKMRAKDNAEMISIYYPGKAFYNKKEIFSIIMVGDQNPPNKDKAIWVKFLNQPTACLHGIELYAKKFNTPVVYFTFKKTSRGNYQVYLQEITKEPRNEQKGLITQKYMQLLEKDIKEQPEYWLWSHKRWKHTFDETKHKIIE
jgi:KDO2-lipid IV(A) lauroyltransferase